MSRRASSLALLAALLGVLGVTVAQAGADPKPKARAAVVGGEAAPKGRYPWMVALSRGCGGTLIAPDRVLTAGHCVEDLRVSDLRLYVGARTRQPGTYRYDGIPARAVDVATHPGYRSLEGGGPDNDVAILKLEAPITDVPTVRLANPSEVALYTGGQPATVIGWGVTRTDLSNAPLATGLRRGGLRILSNRTCGRIYGSDNSFKGRVMLCARSRQLNRRPNTSPCVGDSGGPLVAPGDLQIGIVSFGISCGALHEPTVFSRVAALRSFIDQPEPVWAPQPLDRANVSGEVRVGQIVTCQPPAWRNTVSQVRYRWGVNGVLVATGQRVRVNASAQGRVLQCRAVAENAGGSTPSAASPPIRVP